LSALLDPRIATGMAALLARRRKRIDAGETPIGWKVGFGAPAAMAKLAIDRPLVGFLMRTNEVQSGDSVPLGGWTKPVAEPEVAVILGKDLVGDADEADAAAAIAALAPAIELANLDPAPEEVERILAGNIYHRHVIVGRADRTRSGGSVAGLRTRVTRNGEEIASQPELEANTGRIVATVRSVADLLERCGERLRTGEIVIAGSIIPPLFLTAEDRELIHDVEGLGSVSVRFTHRRHA
jgi:2-keto-4-pentenoate hydratase